MTNAMLDAQAQAMTDYRDAFGSIITVTILSGYKGDDSYEFDGQEFKVRVLETPEADLCHWVDEFLDPYWNVEPIGTYPALEGHRSFWTFGQSYKVTGTERGEFKMA